MIVPDANLLLYAYDSASPFHKKAAEWWRACLSGDEPVGLAAVVVFSFIRIGTNPRVFEQPMTAEEAVGHVRSWLVQPVVHILDTGTGHVEQVLKLLEDLGAAGNLVSDAQLAAIVIEHGAVLHTADTDFVRFPGLRWFNPITNVSSAGLRQRRQP